MKDYKAPKEIIVNGKKFSSLNAAAGFMNINSCSLGRQLNKGLTEYRGYKISYFKAEDTK